RPAKSPSETLSPPSRGRWNAGAFVPSDRICAWSAPAAVLTGAFGRAVFNGLEADRCDALAAPVPDDLLALLVDLAVAAARFAGAAVRLDLAAAALRADVVLRVEVLRVEALRVDF